jgi:hypothetical protein
MKRRQVFRAQASKSQSSSSIRRFANSGPVLPFNPASIPGCQLWLDAADTSSILLSGSSNVSIWIDKSNTGTTAIPTLGPSANPITYVTVDTYPGVYINNNGSIQYNASTYSQLTVQSNFQTTADYSIFAVVNLSNVLEGALQTIYGNERGTSGETRSPNFGAGQSFEFNAAGASRVIDLSFIGSGRLQTSLVSSSSSLTAYTNTTAYGSNTNGLTRFSTDAGPLPRIGGAFGSINDPRFATGYFHEILVYNTALSTIQRQKVEGYLAHKWGITSSLPANHPHKTAAPTYEEPVFVPTLISGSQLWLDALDTSSMSLSGSNVTQIVDKSSNAYTFTGSAGTYPTRTTTLNGIPVISTSTGRYLRTTNFNQNFTTATFFAVVRPTEDITPNGKTGNGYAAYVIASGSQVGDINFVITYANQAQSGDPSKFFIEIDKQGTGFINGALGGASPSTYNPVNTPLNIGAVMSGSSTTNSAYLNGTSVNLTGNFSGTFPLQSGRTVTVFTGFGCDHAEVLIYGSVLTPSQRQRVEGYLAQKWGLQSSLPANHPYKTIAPTGIPRSITIQSLSVLFNTANSSYLSIPANAALTLGTNNHTIEFWMYQTSRNQYANPFNYGNTTQFATNNYYMDAGSTGLGLAIGNGSGNWALAISAGAAPSLNEWHHYAVVRNGTTFTFYLNGINRATATSSISIPAQGDVFRIGNSTTYPIAGYISNFRLVNGTAVYTSNFTPPTSPLTAIPNTQVLLQGLVDRSPNAFTVTSTGSVTLSTSVSPFV